MPQAIRSPLADFHAAQGATLGEYHGAVVPTRFADPLAEYRAVRSACGLLDLSFRVKFAVKGRDAVRFLHRIVSNDLQSLEPGQGTYALLLNAQGHILADLRIYLSDDCVIIDTDADLGDKAVTLLRRYIIGDQVAMEALDLYALGFEGPQARALLAKALREDVPVLADFEHFAVKNAGYPVRVVRAGHTGEPGYQAWLSGESMEALWREALAEAADYGALPCGTEALELLRIEAGLPRYGADFAEDTLPLEAELWSALSFKKGCYVGQEIVERARSRGHVNWKLVGVTIEAPATPPVGEKLFLDGREVGEMTSVCFSPAAGKPIALAYVRREVAEAGVPLRTSSEARALVTARPFLSRPSDGAKTTP